MYVEWAAPPAAHPAPLSQPPDPHSTFPQAPVHPTRRAGERQLHDAVRLHLKLPGQWHPFQLESQLLITPGTVEDRQCLVQEQLQGCRRAAGAPEQAAQCLDRMHHCNMIVVWLWGQDSTYQPCGPGSQRVKGVLHSCIKPTAHAATPSGCTFPMLSSRLTHPVHQGGGVFGKVLAFQQLCVAAGNGLRGAPKGGSSLRGRAVKGRCGTGRSSFLPGRDNGQQLLSGKFDHPLMTLPALQAGKCLPVKSRSPVFLVLGQPRVFCTGAAHAASGPAALEAVPVPRHEADRFRFCAGLSVRCAMHTAAP